MSEESALLRAIRESPEDDATRLVYADWLDEHGRSAQAEFIRLQIRLAGMKPWDEGYQELKWRERVLLRRHAEEWLAPIRPFFHPSFDLKSDPEELGIFRRGFVETAFVDAERFLTQSDDLFAMAPITGLIFWIRSSFLPRVLDCAALGRVKRLRLMSWRSRVCSRREQNIELSCGDFQRLAQCPYLDALEELDLTSQTIPPGELAALIRSPHLQNLQKLTLAHKAVDRAAGFEELGTGMALPSLRRLYLNNNYGSGRFGAWQAAAWPRRLQTLDIGSCDIDIGETVSLLAGAGRAELEHLSLHGMGGGSSQGRLGAVLASLPRLTFLDLSYKGFSEKIGAALAGARFDSLESLNLQKADSPLPAKLFNTGAFPKLRALDLWNSPLAGGLSSLCDSPVTKTLRHLNLQYSSSPDESIVTFARAARMPELEQLSLGEHTPSSETTFTALLAAEGFPRLRSLLLHVPGRKAKMYQILGDSPLLRQLSHLTIFGSLVSAECVRILTESPGFQGLSSLQFWASSINKENRQRVKDHFGERYIG